MNKTKTEYPIKNALVTWIDKVGEGRLEDFYTSRPSLTLDELYYNLELQWHSGYEIIHTKTNTYWRKINTDASN